MARYLDPKVDFIRKAAELCERAAYSPEELDAYDKYLDIIRTERTLREGTRRDALAEGEAIGMKKGEAIGLEKGEAIGLEKGEAKTLERVVVDGKKNGLSIEQIQLITKLTPQQITEILKQNGLL